MLKVAHVQKSNRSAAGHLFEHYARNAEDEQYKYLFRQNKSIDPNMTYLNYNLAPERNKKQNEILKDRLSEVKCLKRKDVNVICSWVLTLPKSFPSEREKEFFEQAYKFLEERYGKKNVISSYVHKDETTPHMHFCFIPVVRDKRTGKEKVSAYELLTRKELMKFHPDLDKHLEKYFGFEVGILNEATKNGNRTVAELKQQTIAEQTQEKQQGLDILILKTQEKINKLEDMDEQLKSLNQKISTSQRILKRQDEIEMIGQKSLTGKITMSPEEAAQLKDMAKSFITLSEKVKPLMLQNQQLKESSESTIKLRIELNKVKKEYESLKSVLASNPDLLKQFKKQEKCLHVSQHQRMDLASEIGDR